MAPDATVLTTCSSTSTPTTRMPRLAMTAAVGNPMYPRPMTATFWNSGIQYHLYDSFAGAAVPERVVGARHFPVVLWLIKQCAHFCNDALAISSNQPRGASQHAFRPLRRVPHHKNRLAQRRC